jgi:hypothetical protein
MVDEPKLCSWCKQLLENKEEWLHESCKKEVDAEMMSMYDDGESSWDWYHNR